MFVEKEHVEDMECDECTNDVEYRIYMNEEIVYLFDVCRKELLTLLGDKVGDCEK